MDFLRNLFGKKQSEVKKGDASPNPDIPNGPPNIQIMKTIKEVKGLIKALDYQEDWRIRDKAAEALGEIGDPRAVDLLIIALKNDKNEYVRRSAAKALGQICDTKAVEPLLAALENADYRLREDVANALEKLGWEPGQSKAGFWYCVGKHDWNKASTFGPSVVSELVNLLKEKYPTIPDQISIATALGEIGDPGAIEPLIAKFENDREDQNVRRAAAIALDKIGATEIKNNELLKSVLFEAIYTDDPNTAVKVLFNEALLAVPISTTQIIDRQYEYVRPTWRSFKLVEGSAEEMRARILANLKSYKQKAPDFREFSVECVAYARAAQINTIVGKHFFPIRVWRTCDSYYVC